MSDTLFIFDGDVFCCRECAPAGATEHPTGETDCPSHCGECGGLIPETLTTDGVRYVIDAIAEYNANRRGSRDVLEQWADIVGDYGLDPLERETLDTFENGEPDIDERCATLQELIDERDARAGAYLGRLIGWAQEQEGDCEDVRRLCLLEMLRADDQTIGPDDVEHLCDETFDVSGREYRVMTDDEADRAWEESLDQYMDDCLLPDFSDELAKYFDRDSWKRDARHDGRGHALASYDGEERDARDYVVFRIN